MSASSGKGLVIAPCNSCPGKEADHAPGYTTVDFRKSQIVPRIGCSPASRHPRRQDGQRCAGRAAGVTFKERIYTPFVTLSMVLSQVLDPDHSCRAAVTRLIVWLAVNHRKPCAPETNSYCDARQRLPLEVIVELVHQTARKIEAGGSDEWLWKGRKVALVDGATVSMPDTLKNQQVFPQSTTQGIGLGFPVARL
ncbi:MAG: hypothetical protein ACLQU5_32975, partial [Isosphaeraceae bacterium]